LRFAPVLTPASGVLPQKTFTRNNANLGDAVCKFDRAC